MGSALMLIIYKLYAAEQMMVCFFNISPLCYSIAPFPFQYREEYTYRSDEEREEAR